MLTENGLEQEFGESRTENLNCDAADHFAERLTPTNQYPSMPPRCLRHRACSSVNAIEVT